MKWYIAICVHESVPKVDISHILIRAASPDQAYSLAMSIGRDKEVSYLADDGENVLWKFAGLCDLREVDDQELTHGSEVYGYIESSEASDYVAPKNNLTAFMDRPSREL